MRELLRKLALPKSSGPRANVLFQEHGRDIFVRTDRLFAYLMFIQWIGAIAAALLARAEHLDRSPWT